ncbi:MAG: Thiol-disulfide isomerase [Myxococcaceae bacterium]|nr:Thiol-disulfide isomerase [Myxococcaceae bacterium]
MIGPTLGLSPVTVSALALQIESGYPQRTRLRVLLEERMRTVLRGLAQTLALTLLLCSGTLPGGAERCAWLTPVAHAQATAATKARARELYTQGQQLFRQGDFTNAQRSFEEAYRAVPNPVVLLSISECQVRAEDYNAAVATLRQYLKEKPSAPDRAQVESQISSLEAKPGTVSIESAPAGATIWVDGENTGYLTPNEISVHAGHHTISLAQSGYQTTEQTVEVGIGSRQRVSISLPPVPSAVVTEEPPVPALPVEEPATVTTDRHGTPAMWAAIGVAGAAGITGTALGISALHKVKQYDDHPSKRLADKGDKLALFADVNFGIAAVAGVTALVLYLTSGHSERPPSDQAFMVAPELAPGQLGATGQLRF